MKTTHLTPTSQDSAVTQLLPRWPSWGVLSHLTILLGLAALLLLPGVANARSTTLPHQASAISHICRATQVTLHGFDAPTMSCLDGQKKRGVRTLTIGGLGPLATHLVFQDACYDDDLVLHWNINLGGAEVCINGSGVLNLTQYFNGLYWNDQVSSFWTGCYSDYFYSDVNREGSVAWAPGGPGGLYTEWHNFSYGGVANDTLSSIWQYYSWGGPHCAP